MEDHGIRLALLEDRHKRLEGEVERMIVKVDEIHEILTQAKGIKWLVIAAAGFAGLVASLMAHFWK